MLKSYSISYILGVEKIYVQILNGIKWIACMSINYWVSTAGKVGNNNIYLIFNIKFSIIKFDTYVVFKNLHLFCAGNKV